MYYEGNRSEVFVRKVGGMLLALESGRLLGAGQGVPCWHLKGEQNSDRFGERASESKGPADAKQQR